MRAAVKGGVLQIWPNIGLWDMVSPLETMLEQFYVFAIMRCVLKDEELKEHVIENVILVPAFSLTLLMGERKTEQYSLGFSKPALSALIALAREEIASSARFDMFTRNAFHGCKCLRLR